MFIDKELYKKGYKKVVGIDEVGRGCVAGPVVCSAVLYPIDIEPFFFKDSKRLSKKKREELVKYIKENAIAIGIGVVESDVIDRINIYNATKLAMKRALEDLKTDFDFIITDYIKFEPYKHIALPKADERSFLVASASVIAKVYRDKLMEEYEKIYPYSFSKHKGYLTKLHKEEIKQYGLSPIHRKSFKIKI